MQLLSFNRPPDKRKAPRKNPGALENKLHNNLTESEAYLQALINLKIFSDAVIQNLIARACSRYLGEAAYE